MAAYSKIQVIDLLLGDAGLLVGHIRARIAASLSLDLHQPFARRQTPRNPKHPPIRRLQDACSLSVDGTKLLRQQVRDFAHSLHDDEGRPRRARTHCHRHPHVDAHARESRAQKSMRSDLDPGASQGCTTSRTRANREPALSLFVKAVEPIQTISAAPMRFQIISYRNVGWNSVPLGHARTVIARSR